MAHPRLVIKIEEDSSPTPPPPPPPSGSASPPPTPVPPPPVSPPLPLPPLPPPAGSFPTGGMAGSFPTGGMAGSPSPKQPTGGGAGDVPFNALMNKTEYTNLLLETANGTRVQAHPIPFTRAPGIGTDIGLRDGSRIEQDLVHKIIDGVTKSVLWQRGSTPSSAGDRKSVV